jgi:hypothetical protein
VDINIISFVRIELRDLQIMIRNICMKCMIRNTYSHLSYLNTKISEVIQEIDA